MVAEKDKSGVDPLLRQRRRAMLQSEMSTYSSWTVCYTRKLMHSSGATWTVAQLNEMCELLSEELPGCRFRPEPIGGGGVEFTLWPGMSDKIPREYKTFRFFASHFPWIDDETPGSASFNVFDHSRFDVMLKAFYGAPAFNVAELQAFQKVMKQVVGLPEGFRMTSVSDRLVKEINKM
jgi:hypothetical protein